MRKSIDELYGGSEKFSIRIWPEQAQEISEYCRKECGWLAQMIKGEFYGSHVQAEMHVGRFMLLTNLHLACLESMKDHDTVDVERLALELENVHDLVREVLGK